MPNMAGVTTSNGHLNNGNNVDAKKKTDVKPQNENKIDMMSISTYTYESLQEAANFLLERTNITPRIGIICGSGMGPLADNLTEKTCFPYSTIPHFPVSTVEGHVGQLVFGYLGDVPVLCMQGRFHYYEGYPLWKCCMPVRVMKLLGITHLIATNAAGGINRKFKVGDIMLIKDHVSMMGFAGNNPLQGPNDERFGSRFPAMNNAYDKDLLNMSKKVAKELKMDSIIKEGVYTCLGGPSFETPAELRLLNILGIDAVGMSTVHEVITARHCEIKVFAFSLITNECVMDTESEDMANHEEVMCVGKQRGPTLAKFVTRVVKQIDQSSKSK